MGIKDRLIVKRGRRNIKINKMLPPQLERQQKMSYF